MAYLETVLRYVVSRTDEADGTELKQVVHKILREGEKLMPTIAKQWFQKVNSKVEMKEDDE